MSTHEQLLRRERLWVRAGFVVMGVSLVLGTIVYGSTDSRIFVAPPLAAGGLLYWLGLRVVPRPSRQARLDRGGALVLPRRLAYGGCLSVSVLLLSFGVLSMGAMGIGERSVGSASRFGDAAVGLVLASVPMFVAGVLLGAGTLMGRGRLELTPTHVEMVPLVGRSRRLDWDGVRGADLADQDTTLLIRGALSRIVVPLAGQRWQGPLIQRIVRQYVIESAEERARMTDPSVLGRWRVPG